MRKIIYLLLSFILGNQVALAADFIAKPTVSIMLNLNNKSGLYFGNEIGNLFFFADSIKGKVNDNGITLTQPEDATVQYLLKTIAIRNVNKVCILTITTTKGYATASIKNLDSTLNRCAIQGDPNGLYFTFTIS